MKSIGYLLLLTLLPITLFAADFESTLKAMKESQIVEPLKDKEAVAYRFTCIPTFDHPFSIKIRKSREGFIMSRKVLSGKGGWEPGFLAESVKSDLADAALDELDKLLLDLKFSEMTPEPERGGLDGSQWIIEIVKNGTYKKVERWSPKEGDALNELGQWFLKTSQWKPQSEK